MRFLVTRELGRLARWLRFLGYDTVYAGRHETRTGLLINSLREERTLLTRDRGLTGHKGIRTVWIRGDRVQDQLRQTLQETGSEPDKERLFSRCLSCNVVLEEVPKETVRSKVPAYVYETTGIFVRCGQCRKIFWPGTHLVLVQDFLQTFKLDE